MAMPNTSIVVPALNEEDNLPNLIRNLHGQIMEGDEFIMVDGGSEDNTIAIAQRAGARIIKAPNTSIGEARAIGTEAANNEIVVSTDADALPPNGWLDRIKANFENNPELDVLYGTITDVNGVPIRTILGKFSTLVRGASGNNTAFRKSSYDELDGGYTDVNFAEDWKFINYLARYGKCRRDGNLVMVMNMDRDRYQTAPILGLGTAATVAGLFKGGDYGKMLASAGAGVVGTELVHEQLAGAGPHHDEVGAGIALAGRQISSSVGTAATGLGGGIFAHHILTEGFSGVPSRLASHTDEFIKRDK